MPACARGAGHGLARLLNHRKDTEVRALHDTRAGSCVLRYLKVLACLFQRRTCNWRLFSRCSLMRLRATGKQLSLRPKLAMSACTGPQEAK